MYNNHISSTYNVPNFFGMIFPMVSFTLSVEGNKTSKIERLVFNIVKIQVQTSSVYEGNHGNGVLQSLEEMWGVGRASLDPRDWGFSTIPYYIRFFKFPTNAVLAKLCQVQ
jgi:hypothetical protein